MEFPKNKSLRNKALKVNGKDIKLIPWNNTQLVEFESLTEENPNEYKHNLVREYLITPNVETKSKLTILDEQIILVELYKLSKSSSIDITYHCNSCKTSGCNANIKLDKTIKVKELQDRDFSTKDYKFNLNRNSNYRIDFNKETKMEYLKYFASFVDSFDYKDKNYPVTNLDEFVEYLKDEVHPQSEFDEILKKFEEIKPDIESKTTVICEHCGNSQELDFRIIDFLA